ncbi:hypothetical protein L7F22_064409 [Adiantum nelumboides]|nr:hypothetical protein [Adiantum nelumboides]
MAMPREERARTPYVGYLRPLIADGDTGFGGATETAKLCKLFVERGAANVQKIVLVARTNAEAANLLQSNIDKRDYPFILAVINPALQGKHLAILLNELVTAAGKAGPELQAIEAYTTFGD